MASYLRTVTQFVKHTAPSEYVQKFYNYTEVVARKLTILRWSVTAFTVPPKKKNAMVISTFKENMRP